MGSKGRVAQFREMAMTHNIFTSVRQFCNQFLFHVRWEYTLLDTQAPSHFFELGFTNKSGKFLMTFFICIGQHIDTIHYCFANCLLFIKVGLPQAALLSTFKWRIRRVALPWGTSLRTLYSEIENPAPRRLAPLISWSCALYRHATTDAIICYLKCEHIAAHC